MRLASVWCVNSSGNKRAFSLFIHWQIFLVLWRRDNRSDLQFSNYQLMLISIWTRKRKGIQSVILLKFIGCASNRQAHYNRVSGLELDYSIYWISLAKNFKSIGPGLNQMNRCFLTPFKVKDTQQAVYVSNQFPKNKVLVDLQLSLKIIMILYPILF